jgi:hypothetical protein
VQARRQIPGRILGQRDHFLGSRQADPKSNRGSFHESLFLKVASGGAVQTGSDPIRNSHSMAGWAQKAAPSTDLLVVFGCVQLRRSANRFKTPFPYTVAAPRRCAPASP